MSMNRNHLIIAVVVVLSFAVGIVSGIPFLTVVGLLGVVCVVMGNALADLNKTPTR